MHKNSNIARSSASLGYDPNSPYKIPRSISPLVSAMMSTKKTSVSRPVSHVETQESKSPSRNQTPSEFAFHRPNSIDYYSKMPSDRYESQIRGNDNKCLNCQKLENQIRIVRDERGKSSDKSNLSDKHLKQYESLLAIKENRLKEKEIMLNNQIFILEEEKGKLEKERIELKKEIEKKDQIIHHTKMRFSRENLTANPARSWDFLGKIHNESEKEVKSNDFEEGSESEYSKLHAMLQIIQEKEEKLRFREEQISQKTFELADVLARSEKQLRERSFSLESFERQLKAEKENFERVKISRQPEENKSIEELKAAFEFQRDSLEAERKHLEKSYVDKCEEIEKPRATFFNHCSILNTSSLGSISIMPSYSRDDSPNKSYSEEFEEIQRIKHVEISCIKPDLETEIFPLISIIPAKHKLRKLELFTISSCIIETLPSVSIIPKKAIRFQESPSRSPRRNAPGKHAGFLDELSFGKADHSDSTSVMRDQEISKRTSIQERDSDFRWNHTNEFEPESRDTILSHNDPNRSAYISPEDSEMKYSRKVRVPVIERIKNRYNNKITVFQQQLKLKDLYIQQEIEKFTARSLPNCFVL